MIHYFRYIAGRMNIVRRSEVNGLNTFVGTFSLPSLIFLSLAKLDFSLVNWKFLLAILIAKSSVFFVVLIISLLTKNSNAGRSALFAIFTTQSNDFAIGYPMSEFIISKTYILMTNICHTRIRLVSTITLGIYMLKLIQRKALISSNNLTLKNVFQ